jgi:hypothetical protein
MYQGHVLGYLIRAIRSMAANGASVVDVMDYLRHHTADEYAAHDYLVEAFDIPRVVAMSLPRDSTRDDMTAAVDENLRQTRQIWTDREIAELMRVRDYASFIRFAKSERVVATVCNANHHSGKFIGRNGYRCYGGDVFVVTRMTSPGEGLVAADPGDPRLIKALERFAAPLSYAEYVHRLQTSGYRVLGPDEGYVIEDAWGNRFYEGYRLHGVYSADSGEPVWSGKRGERLLVTINRLLGADLVLGGPHDDWEHRNDKTIAGPLWGPHAPCIEFNTEGQIHNLSSVSDMARHSRWHSHHWRRLYPHHVEHLSENGAHQ